MNFLKIIFCGTLIMVSAPCFSMERPPHKRAPSIDCFTIQTEEQLIGFLRMKNIIGSFNKKDWNGLKDIVKNANDALLSKESKESIHQAIDRINRGSMLVTSGEPSITSVCPSVFVRVNEWIVANKGKTIAVGLTVLGLVDTLQAYCRTDAAKWKESDLKGKLKLIKQKMLISKGTSRICF